MLDEKDQPIKSDIAKREEEILQFWQDNDIFKKSLAKNITGPASAKATAGKEFVFYEGPPTANGRPGLHHLEARAFKDAIPRYKTMRGFKVSRRGGWDTHGLPVEIETEKKLGLKSKKDIESYGIGKFNEECKKSVWSYVDEWRSFTERIGYWVDLDNPYITYKPEYMESVWHILATAHKRDLLYQDYRVVPWCTRCGTVLSSHELAQGYADVKDLSVYVKFELEDEPNTFMLAWTTTPWTLPGNVALAVGADIDYVKLRALPEAEFSDNHTEQKHKDEFIILARKIFEKISRQDSNGDYILMDKTEQVYKLVTEIKGDKLLGKKYKPLWPFLADQLSAKERDKSFQVYPASFVTTEDGTGVVHTAVMYGQDDFELGTRVGLPKYHIVNEDGTFKTEAGFLAGRLVKDEATDVEIIKDLAGRELLFKKEKYTHTYPFCWRCKTPLIYYARDSWYIRMSALKDELVRENQDINWEPAHIKDGRFGEWLAGVKDWAISRERYWGTPLPVWRSADKKEILVVDSIETLKKHTKKSGNKYFVLRHGEAEHNALGIIDSTDANKYTLTETGRKQIETTVADLKNKKIDIIYSSPFFRTKESAEILADSLNIAKAEIIFDDRLKELDFGSLHGQEFSEFLKYEKENMLLFSDLLPDGESYLDAKRRFGKFIYELEEKVKGKNILIVTHGIGAEVLVPIALAANNEDSKKILDKVAPKVGEVNQIDFVPLPHNNNFELDLHRPFIDEVKLVSDNGTELSRVPEVMDVWFDSGAMPFAQDHYPFENKEKIENGGYPADFISEAIDQTRGWFYTLHAVGALMGRGKAYKNVICLGHILDSAGKKMSKSVGNVVNPWEMIDKYGVDVLRFWMYSVNQPGDSKNFDERTVDEVNKKVFNLLKNVVNFYEMFKTRAEPLANFSNLPALDRWVVAKLAQLKTEMTNSLDRYDLFSATRYLREFVGDLSQWYIRRSRDRFKNGGEDALIAEATTRFVLLEISKLMAPFAPFFAEDIFKKLKTESDSESVHLAEWSKWQVDFDIEKTIKNMDQVREIVSLALEARSKAGVKVRQPLALLTIKELVDKDLWSIIKDEVNVKKIKHNSELAEKIFLDTNLTEDLKEEGKARDL
ncbi:MAG: class I tRNA ligase family protein, partial [Patescibacteria group bacterium]